MKASVESEAAFSFVPGVLMGFEATELEQESNIPIIFAFQVSRS